MPSPDWDVVGEIEDGVELITDGSKFRVRKYLRMPDFSDQERVKNAQKVYNRLCKLNEKVFTSIKYVSFHELSTYVDSEFLIYGDLKTLTKEEAKNQISERKKLKIAKRISSAIVCMEKCGIFHNNLCPRNILFDAELNPKLNDVTFSALPEFDSCFTMQFTRECEAPDKIKSIKSNVYSFGKILKIIDNQLGTPTHLFNNIIDMCSKEIPEDRPSPNELYQIISNMSSDYLNKTSIVSTEKIPQIECIFKNVEKSNHFAEKILFIIASSYKFMIFSDEIYENIQNKFPSIWNSAESESMYY